MHFDPLHPLMGFWAFMAIHIQDWGSFCVVRGGGEAMRGWGEVEGNWAELSVNWMPVWITQMTELGIMKDQVHAHQSQISCDITSTHSLFVISWPCIKLFFREKEDIQTCAIYIFYCYKIGNMTRWSSWNYIECLSSLVTNQCGQSQRRHTSPYLAYQYF